MPSRAKKAEEYRTPPELMIECALMLQSQLPSGKRSYALRGLAEHQRAIHQEMGEPLPEWVCLLSELADQEDNA